MYPHKFTNYDRDQAERRSAYKMLRDTGYSHKQAVIMRDWRFAKVRILCEKKVELPLLDS